MSSELTWTFDRRLETLRREKQKQTAEKQALIGSMDHDDWALVLPPPARRKVVKTTSSSGMPITDCLIDGFEVEPNHPLGGFFGPRSVGHNYRRLLESHPVYIDPSSSLAGAYMVNFMSYRKPHWNPDLSFADLHETQIKYQLGAGIGATQHFCQDLAIGLELGWSGILKKIRHYRQVNTAREQLPVREGFSMPEPDLVAGLYDGLEDVVLGTQDWICRHAQAAREMAGQVEDAPVQKNLLEVAEINERLVSEPPRTFREACQWILWFQLLARMYNGSGSLGRLDLLLTPFYERDAEAGILDDEEAIFHIACLLLRDTAYIQLGGPARDGHDVTNPVSYMVLEAAHRLKIPANVAVCVGRDVDPELLRRGVEIMIEDKTGIPKYLGSDSVVGGFARNGFPVELARERAYAGCHWYGIPGREYTIMDCVKINLGVVFDVALREMMSMPGVSPSMDEMWSSFVHHLERAIAGIARGLDVHLEHMHTVFPELVMDLCCHGPIERGMDASHGGVEFYNMCLDGAALATVADSFAALEQRVEVEKRLTWSGMLSILDSDWAGPEGERARLMMSSISRYGSGGSRADEYARRVAQTFTDLVRAHPTPAGFNMIPGLFSWANTIPMGENLGATPNGRHAGDPISHGANPDPGFRKDGAPTAMAAAIASIQPGFGNTAPMQIELDPALSRDEGGVDNIASLIRTHFDLGGTQINMNVMDADQVLEAHRDPSRYPDLVVRVTGFSAYFASLSPEFRQLVVDRIIRERQPEPI